MPEEDTLMGLLGGGLEEGGSLTDQALLNMLQQQQPQGRFPNPIASLVQPLQALLYRKDYQNLVQRQRQAEALKKLLTLAQIRQRLATAQATQSREERMGSLLDMFKEQLEAEKKAGAAGAAGPLGKRREMQLGLSSTGPSFQMRERTTVSQDVIDALLAGDFEKVGQLMKGQQVPIEAATAFGTMGGAAASRAQRKEEHLDRQAFQQQQQADLQADREARRRYQAARLAIDKEKVSGERAMAYNAAGNLIVNYDRSIGEIMKRMDNAMLLNPGEIPKLQADVAKMRKLRDSLIENLEQTVPNIAGKKEPAKSARQPGESEWITLPSGTQVRRRGTTAPAEKGSSAGEY